MRLVLLSALCALVVQQQNGQADPVHGSEEQLPQEKLPETLYFIFDMEYDCCTDHAELANLNTRKSCLKIMAIRCRRWSSGTSGAGTGSSLSA